MPETKSILKLGEILLKGEKFLFRPAKTSHFSCATSKPLEIGISYQYEEAGPLKDSSSLRLSVELDGHNGGSATIDIKDAPFLMSDQWGFIFHTVPAPKSGKWKGRYTVEGSYEGRPWLSGGPAEKHADFREKGAFTLDVR